MRSVLIALLVSVAVQQTSLKVEVHGDGRPVRDADVVVNGTTYHTADDGSVVIPVAPGQVDVVVVKAGFTPAQVSVDAMPDRQQSIVVELKRNVTLEEHVTVSATRTDRGIEDQPMRVEVVDREEIDEKSMMTPGDVVMLLNETGGLRVQATSPSLGAASVRIQGMRGRYTRFLSDGLPTRGVDGRWTVDASAPLDGRVFNGGVRISF